jgi:4-hydroxy-tetrahydrodipicolinate synthase
VPVDLATVSAVPVTPFTPEGAIDEAALAGVVERMVGQGVRVVVPCGGTGEFSALTAEERDRVAQVVLAAAGPAAVLVGVGGDLAGAARAAKGAVRAGAAGVMVHALTDPYLTADGVARYVETIATAADGIIVPYLRGRLPAPAALDRICALEQAVAVKWAIPDVQAFALFAERYGDAVLPLCGLAESWAPFLALAGSRGFTSGLANVDAALPLALDAALAAGDYDAAMALWRRITPFEALRARHDAGNNVPGVKEAMAIAGLIPCAAVRPPLAPLSPDDRAELERIVVELKGRP